MKKILILAYDFPPYVSAGALRPNSWYLHFKKFGFEPIVITRQWENKYGDHRDYVLPSKQKETVIETSEFGTIIRTPFSPNWSQRMVLKHGESKYKLARKFFSLYYEVAQYAFPIGPKKEIYAAAKKYLSEHQVDFILASGEPFVLFNYASKLSKQFSTKWIADYRDPWSQSAWRRSNFLFRFWNKRSERKALKNVSAVSTVSNYVETLIRENMQAETRVHLQMNGYDSELITDQIIHTPRKDETLTIGFAGSIYPWHPINNVLETITKYVNSHPESKIELRMIGTNNESVLKQLISDNYSELESVVKFQSKLVNKKLIAELANCHLLLLFNDHAVLGTKIFNYLAVKRPVLLCYTDCEETSMLKENHFPYRASEFDQTSLQLEMIEKTNAGIGVKNSSHLISLLESYQNELNSLGKIETDSANIEEYSRLNQIKAFATFLETL